MLLGNLLGILILFFIVYWFWLYKPKNIRTIKDKISIIVNNSIYEPAQIRTQQGKKIQLNFICKDPSPCAGTVVFDDFAIRQELELEQTTSITLAPQQTGEFEFTCQKTMYPGKLIVEAA